jgi:cell division protein FtsQ
LRAATAVLLPVVVAAALGAGLWPPLREAARHHPYFAVREVVVRSPGRLAADQVRAAAGIAPGMSIWDVDAAAAEARLRAQPWLRAARVRREPPHRVVIQVREERPLAILTLEGAVPRDYYVGAHGRIFSAVGGDEPRDLPYLSGLGPADLRDGETFGPHALRRALTLVRVAARLASVSEIHVDRARGLTLMPVRPAVPIELGWTRFEEKLARVRRVMPLWAGREQEIAAVSLLFDDELIVRTRSAKRGA